MTTPALSVGARVREGQRVGTVLEVYEHTDKHGTPLGRKSTVVHFDGDKIPTVGVWLDNLTPVPPISPAEAGATELPGAGEKK